MNDEIYVSVVPGSKDLSGDDNPNLTPRLKAERDQSKLKLKRPKILKRRDWRDCQQPTVGGRDWSERSVKVFKVIN